VKVYITKFALTKGIVVADAVQDAGSKERIHVKGAYPWDWTTFGLGDWHATADKAEARAIYMRDQRVAKLRNEADRIAAKNFVVPNLV
jgi:hypothetical protein